MSLHCTFKIDASLDGCWAKSGYQDGNIANQGFIFPNVYGDGICDEKMNIYECNFDGGDCCKAVTLDLDATKRDAIVTYLVFQHHLFLVIHNISL